MTDATAVGLRLEAVKTFRRAALCLHRKETEILRDLRREKNRFARCLTAVICLSSACITGLVHAQVSVPKDRPNVLLIVCDDLNDYVSGLNGHPQARTPHLERLAETGVSFTRAYSNYPICGASRASCITSIYPHTYIPKK